MAHDPLDENFGSIYHHYYANNATGVSAQRSNTPQDYADYYESADDLDELLGPELASAIREFRGEPVQEDIAYGSDRRAGELERLKTRLRSKTYDSPEKQEQATRIINKAKGRLSARDAERAYAVQRAAGDRKMRTWEAAIDEGWDDERDPYDDDDRSMFANPGGRSALRAASRRNPRNRPCPTCGGKNRLTPADVAHGYQCDSCADRDERGGY